MADIELVIKIPEEEYRWIKKSDKTVFADVASKECMLHAIKNGTPLSKGHGRLIDEKDVSLLTVHLIDGVFVCDAPTIIEADGDRCQMSDKQKLEKIRQTLYNLDEEVAEKKVTRDYWDGFCKVFNAVEGVLNENSDGLSQSGNTIQ